MHDLKVISNLVCVLVVLFLLPTMISGCSDDPESQAQEQLNESTRNALDQAREGLYVSKTDESDDTDKMQAASDTISSAISKNRNSKGAVSSATFAKANISFAQGQKLRGQLQLASSPVTDALGEIAAINSGVGELSMGKERLEYLVESNNEEIRKLQELVNGGGDKIGLKAEMQTRAAELSDLESQKISLEDSRDKLDASGSKFQEEANAKFHQAEAVSGDDKVSLSAEGFELLRKSNSEMVKAQGLSNQIQALDDRIGVVKPVVEKLQGDLKKVQAQINTLSNSSDFAMLKSQLSQISLEYNKARSNFESSIKKLAELKKNYTELTEEVVAFLQLAIEDYEKVTSGDLRTAALERTAESCFWIGKLYAENSLQEKHIISSIEYIYPSVEGASVLDGLIASSKSQSSALSKQGFEYFDKSIDMYAELTNAVGSDRVCYIMKRHALVLYCKSDLAEKLGEYEVSDKAVEQLEEIMKKATECDPDFSRSVVGRIIDGKGDSVIVLPVDNTLAYENIRKQLQSHGWPKLPVEEREGAVNGLLEELAALEKEDTLDRQAFDRILGPEKMKLENALKRGFEDIGGDFAGGGVSDPNSF